MGIHSTSINKRSNIDIRWFRETEHTDFVLNVQRTNGTWARYGCEYGIGLARGMENGTHRKVIDVEERKAHEYAQRKRCVDERLRTRA